MLTVNRVAMIMRAIRDASLLTFRRWRFWCSSCGSVRSVLPISLCVAVKLGHYCGTVVQLRFNSAETGLRLSAGGPKQVTTFMDVHLAALLMVGIALSYILLRALWI